MHFGGKIHLFLVQHPNVKDWNFGLLFLFFMWHLSCTKLMICWVVTDGSELTKSLGFWWFQEEDMQEPSRMGKFWGTSIIFETCCTCRHPPTSQVVSSFRVGVLHHQPLRHARAAIKAKRQGQGKFQWLPTMGSPISIPLRIWSVCPKKEIIYPYIPILGMGLEPSILREGFGSLGYITPIPLP